MAFCNEGETCEYAMWTAEKRFDFLLTQRALDELDAAFANSGKSGRVLRGLKDSRLMEDDIYLRRLREIPNLRVVVVLRDPIDALVSHYNDMECWRLMSMEEMARFGLTDCLEGFDGRGWGIWSQRIRSAMEMFTTSSIFVTHLDMLSAPRREDSEQSWNKLFKFLGVEEATRLDGGSEPWHGIQVRNKRKEEAFFDLCADENRATLELLKARYADEYERLEGILLEYHSTVPESLRTRRTRCDVATS
eukprot:TRINITY_DN29987_c0_g1_i4.p1 TRINITY_DN29987_c0_g1~~TRINITY_DN29987_c0_g1_i4.p1  ORF type:complete len:248 (+),score=43.48 TRINITY_DN29987_c0_g1_i4:704-1447(+)